MENKDFKLYIRDFLPESIFIQQYGIEAFETVKKNTPNTGQCEGCKHEPRNSDPNKVLNIHIYKIDKENPANSKAIYLCKGCHSTQHIRASIQKGWIKFVNSSLSQGSLVSFSRHGIIRQLYDDSKVFDLKKTPEEYLNDIQTGNFVMSSTLKVLFTNQFIFTDL